MISAIISPSEEPNCCQFSCSSAENQTALPQILPNRSIRRRFVEEGLASPVDNKLLGPQGLTSLNVVIVLHTAQG